jgi:succinate dehydrogenase / fumarate reductase flavoprotein subunit
MSKNKLEQPVGPGDANDNRISRRKFLGTVAGTGAALTVSGLLAGCKAEGGQSTNSTPDVQVPVGLSGVERPFGVHEADVLVIGGGITGLFAAKEAMSGGASVIIVDKGPWGHSGTSGINWGHDMTTNEWVPDDGSSYVGVSIWANDGMVDQVYDAALGMATKAARPVATNEQMGNFAERDLEGVTISKNSEGALTADHGCFPRAFAQYAKRKGAKIFDRTMVTGVLLSDKGEAAGAVAINLITGDAMVFRAKSVIMATGAYAWCYGWTGNTACTIAGPECTGDGHSMFLNLGLEMRDMEQLPFDCVQIYPTSTAYGMGTLGLSVVNHKYALNKNGERYTQIMDDPSMGLNSVFMRLTMREVYEGRALDNGCVYCDTSELDKLNRYYRRARTRNRMIGYELPERAELHWEFWENTSRPAAVSTTGETLIPGLFHAAAGSQSWFGLSFFGCVGSGYMAGKNAAIRAKEIARPNIVWSQVQDALNEAYGKLESEPAKGVRALSIYHKIQQTMFDGLSPLRDEKGIQGVIDALIAIKEKDFPTISVPSKSRRYNQDWRKAMEIPFMWDCVMGTAQAALIRKETRGTHCRTDFPKMDNANWLVNTIVQKKDGTWTAVTRPIVDTYVPAAQVAQMVPEIGLTA